MPHVSEEEFDKSLGDLLQAERKRKECEEKCKASMEEGRKGMARGLSCKDVDGWFDCATRLCQVIDCARGHKRALDSATEEVEEKRRAYQTKERVRDAWAVLRSVAHEILSLIHI